MPVLVVCTADFHECLRVFDAFVECKHANNELRHLLVHYTRNACVRVSVRAGVCACVVLYVEYISKLEYY